MAFTKATPAIHSSMVSSTSRAKSCMCLIRAPSDEDRVYTSPDKHHAVVWQYIPEQEHKVYLIELSPADQLQPKLKTIQYFKPRNRVKMDRLQLFNLKQKSKMPINNQLFENPYIIVNIE